LLLVICSDASASFDVKKAFENVHRDLSAKYPGHILPASDLEWIFMNAGGFMGSMCVLHASLTEYVLFFGTAVDTTGNSGWASFIVQFFFFTVAEKKFAMNFASCTHSVLKF